MTELVMKPEKAPVVRGLGLYRVYMNRKPIDLLFRARNAGEADAMLQYLFAEQTRGKTLTVPPELLNTKERNNDRNKEEDKEKSGTEAATPDQDGNADD